MEKERLKTFALLIIMAFMVCIIIGSLGFTVYTTTVINEKIRNIEEILNNYTEYHYHYYPYYPLERLDSIVLNTTMIDNNVSTNHYKGCDSFTEAQNGIGAPPGWNKTSGYNNRMSVVDERWNHDKIFQMNNPRGGFGAKPQIDKWIGVATTGTVEYWYAQGSPGVDVFMDEDHHYLWAPNGTIAAEWGNKYKQFSWYNGSDLFWDNTTSSGLWSWHNVKVEFRCGGAVPFANLTENTFNLYFDDVLIYPNCTFQNNVTSIASISFEVIVATCNIDAISWSWGNLELIDVPYTLGDKDTTWTIIEKQIECYYYFQKDFHNIYNWTYSYNFTTNRTLDGYTGSQFSIFDYQEGNWEDVYSEVLTDFSISPTTFTRSCIKYTNPSSASITHIKTILKLSNIYFDFEMNVNTSCHAFFWIPE